MNVFIDAFKAWDSQTQLIFCLASLGMVCLTVWRVIALFTKTVVLMINGYPPTKPEKQECEHDENLTRLCLKPAGCKTVEECQECISNNGKKP